MSSEEILLPGHLKDPNIAEKQPGSSRRKKKGWWGRMRSRLFVSTRRREARREKRMEQKAIKKAMLLRKKESKNRKKAAKGHKNKSGFFGISNSKNPLLGPQKYSLRLAFNSLIIFLLTYLLTYFLYQFIIILFASYYNIDGILYYYDLTFNDVSALWNPYNIILITGSAPVLCLIIGLFIYRRAIRFKKIKGYQVLFLLWFSLHLLNHFLGAFVSGVITSDGFGYVANWLYMGMGMKLFLALSFLLIMMIIGYNSAGKFLLSIQYRVRVNNENTKHLLLYTILFPLLAGTLILFLVRIPMNSEFPYESIIIFTMFLGMIPAVFSRNAIIKKSAIYKGMAINTIRYEHIMLLILILVFYRGLLSEGLKIVMHYSFSFSASLG